MVEPPRIALRVRTTLQFPPPTGEDPAPAPEGQSSSNQEDFTFDTWILVQEELSTIRALLAPAQVAENFEDMVPGSIVDPAIQSLETLEGYLNKLSQGHFEVVKENKSLKATVASHDKRLTEVETIVKKGQMTQRVSKIESTIATNIATSNLVETKNFEGSDAYIGICNETADVNTTVKIPNLDVFEDLKGAPLAAKVCEVISKACPTVSLAGMEIKILKDGTKKDGDKHVVPVLLYAGDKDARYNLDLALKAKFETAYHWPLSIVKDVKEIRKQLLLRTAPVLGTLPFSKLQIRIRPSKSGKCLVVSYRENFGDDWIFHHKAKTPAPKELLRKAKAKQPCTSDYFTL